MFHIRVAYKFYLFHMPQKKKDQLSAERQIKSSPTAPSDTVGKNPVTCKLQQRRNRYSDLFVLRLYPASLCSVRHPEIILTARSIKSNRSRMRRWNQQSNGSTVLIFRSSYRTSLRQRCPSRRMCTSSRQRLVSLAVR